MHAFKQAINDISSPHYFPTAHKIDGWTDGFAFAMEDIEEHLRNTPAFRGKQLCSLRLGTQFSLQQATLRCIRIHICLWDIM